MQHRHRAALSAALKARKLNASAIHEGLSGDPVLLPIFIGAYRRRDEVYRIVINGQTGKLIGKAPISWTKVALVTGIVLAVLFMLLLCLGLTGAIASSL